MSEQIPKSVLLQQLLAEYGGDVEQIKKDLLTLAPKQSFNKQPNSNAPVLISLDKVSKTYKRGKQEVKALDTVSLIVHEKEIVALIGPSGSGKSTALNVMSGLDTPNSGSILVSGQDIAKLSNNERAKFRSKNLGFIFQFFYLQPFLTLKTNVEVPGMFSGLDKATRKKRAEEFIAAVGLKDRQDHKPKELSGGQMQRAAIARALLNQPRILLADEPTGNLDSTNAQEVVALFKYIRDTFGTAVVIVTHDPAVAAQADRVIEMKDGKVI